MDSPRHFPNDNCGDPNHDAILEAWYERANARLDAGLPDPRARPAMASIQEISEWCHSRHSSHLRPGFSRSLCAQMAFEVAYLGQEPADVSWLHSLEPEQGARRCSQEVLGLSA